MADERAALRCAVTVRSFEQKKVSQACPLVCSALLCSLLPQPILSAHFASQSIPSTTQTAVLASVQQRSCTVRAHCSLPPLLSSHLFPHCAANNQLISQKHHGRACRFPDASILPLASEPQCHDRQQWQWQRRRSEVDEAGFTQLASELDQLDSPPGSPIPPTDERVPVSLLAELRPTALAMASEQSNGVTPPS